MLHFSNAKGRVSDLPTEILMWIGGFGGVREWVMMRRVNKNWASLPAIPLLSYYGFRASLSGRYLPPKYPPPLLNVQYGISRDEVLFLMEMNSEEAALKVLKTRTFSQDFYQRILDWVFESESNHFLVGDFFLI